MKIGDFSGDGQPEAKAARFVAAIFGGEVGFEDATEIFFRDAFSLIDDANAQPVSGIRLGEAGEMHFDLAIGGGGVDGSGDEIGDEAEDEDFVHFDEDIFRDDRRDIDIFFVFGVCLLGSLIDGLLDDEIETTEVEIEAEIFGEEEGLTNVSAHGFDIAHGDWKQF